MLANCMYAFSATTISASLQDVHAMIICHIAVLLGCAASALMRTPWYTSLLHMWMHHTHLPLLTSMLLLCNDATYRPAQQCCSC
jgi:hypothetical protein